MITAMLRQDGLIHETEVFLCPNGINLSMPKRRNGEDPAWFLVTPVNPKTMLPISDQACCTNLISAICTQLEEFGAMTYGSARRKTNGWIKQAKSNGKAIIEGGQATKGRPSAKGKLWELRTMTTKPPGVTLVDMVKYEELSEKICAQDNKSKKKRRKGR